MLDAVLSGVQALLQNKKAPWGAFVIRAEKNSSSKGLVNKRSQLRFAQCADFRGSELAFVEDHQRGDAANAEFAGDIAVLVDVEFGNLQFASMGGGEFIQGRGDHFAGAAPFGPKIDEHGLVGLQYISLKAGIGDVFDQVAGHKSSRFSNVKV